MTTEKFRNKQKLIDDNKTIKYKINFGDLLYIEGYDIEDPVYRSNKLPNLIIQFYQANLNVIAQNGCFIHFHGNDKPLESYFTNKRQANNLLLPKIKCWNIHKHLKMYVYQYLNGLNPPVTNELLYPQEEKIAQIALDEYLKNKPPKI